MARTVDELLRRTEARAQEKLRGDLRALKSESLAVLDSPLLRRHPHITLAAAAVAGAAAVPFVLRLLRSPGRAMRLAGMAAPFLKDVLPQASGVLSVGSPSRPTDDGSTR